MSANSTNPSAHYADSELPDCSGTYFTRYGQTLRHLSLKQVVHVKTSASKTQKFKRSYVIDPLKFDPYYQLFFVKLQFKQSGGVFRLYEDGKETYGRSPHAYPKRNKRYLDIRLSSNFTEQEDEFIRSNYLKADNHDIAWQLYALTGLYRTDLQVSARLVILGLSRKGKDQYMYYGMWNFPMMEYLRDHYQTKDNIELAEKINRLTKEKVTANLVCGRLKTMGWKRDIIINRGCFTTESRAEEAAAIGAISERVHAGDGLTYKFIKVEQPNKWMPYNRYVWEQANGEIPSSHVIRYIDGDTLNCELSNLECISRGELMVQNSPKGRDRKRTARKAVACRRINRIRKRRGAWKINYRGVPIQKALQDIEFLEPIGTIEVRRCKGVTSQFLPHIKTEQPNTWELLAHYNWIKANGEIPKDKILRYKDGDSHNCNLSNLEYLTKEEIEYRRKNKAPLMQKVYKRERQRKEAGLSLMESLLQGY